MRSEAPSSADVAWVVIDTPLAPAALARFCTDIERLYRVNPYYEFRAWRDLGPGRFEAEFRNLSIGRDLATRLTLDQISEFEFELHYDRGAKRKTYFRIEHAPRASSRLRITDDYAARAGATPADPAEADRSLHAWGVALHDYLRREARWGRYAAWRWYMRRVWVPMKPAARRITFIILMVTLAEIALAALVLAIYWIEHGTRS